MQISRERCGPGEEIIRERPARGKLRGFLLPISLVPYLDPSLGKLDTRADTLGQEGE